MYLYIRTCLHYVTYIVNYQYLKLNTKYGTVGTHCWVHKFIHFLNLDFINPYPQIHSVYILSSPMYDYDKNVLYIIIISILPDLLINSLNISIIQCIRVVWYIQCIILSYSMLSHPGYIHAY